MPGSGCSRGGGGGHHWGVGGRSSEHVGGNWTPEIPPRGAHSRICTPDCHLHTCAPAQKFISTSLKDSPQEGQLPLAHPPGPCPSPSVVPPDPNTKGDAAKPGGIAPQALPEMQMKDTDMNGEADKGSDGQVGKPVVPAARRAMSEEEREEAKRRRAEKKLAEQFEEFERYVMWVR